MNIPKANRIVDTIAILLGFLSTKRPNAAAPMPRKKIISVKPMSAWNFVMSNASIRFFAYCE